MAYTTSGSLRVTNTTATHTEPAIKSSPIKLKTQGSLINPRNLKLTRIISLISSAGKVKRLDATCGGLRVPAVLKQYIYLVKKANPAASYSADIATRQVTAPQLRKSCHCRRARLRVAGAGNLCLGVLKERVACVAMKKP